MLDEAGAGAHGGGIGGEPLAGSNYNGLMNADEEFAVGTFGALRTGRAAAAGGGVVIGVVAFRGVPGLGVGLAGECFSLRTGVAVGGGVVGEAVVVIEAVGVGLVQGGQCDGAMVFAGVVLGTGAVAGVGQNFERRIGGELEVCFGLLGDGVLVGFDRWHLE